MNRLAMRRFFQDLFSAPFQLALVLSFSLVAATTFAIGAWVISHTIEGYLVEMMADRINRNMRLAMTLYEAKLHQIAGVSKRLALDPGVHEGLVQVGQGEAAGYTLIDSAIAREMSAAPTDGNLFVAVVEPEGQTATARLRPIGREDTRTAAGGDWRAVPLVAHALTSRQAGAATAVLPAEILEAAGLATQACIEIIETPKASATLCDPSEGRAGLALIAVTPIVGEHDRLLGAVVAFHLFNNDFTFVDQVKRAAGIDTVTIFHGDLRVSTNVQTPEGRRAIGTRVSEEVGRVVLEEGRPYIGPAFVINENYITRYDPLRDQDGRVIGILYVGLPQATLARLVGGFNLRVMLVALATILATFLLALPISRRITRPLKELRELAAANRRVASGDLSVRVPVRAGGDVGQLAVSFNAMLDELQAKHDQLVHSEKLASLGQLAAGVAHGLNNPLATILLYSDILLRECPADDPRRSDLEMIVNETRRCKGIVSSLLDFARQNQVAARPTDINALITALIETERRRERAIGIEVTLDLDSALPIIQADPEQIREVLANLIANALDAMPQGGRLTLRTRCKPAGMITIEVEDTGVGIPPQHLSRLFTPFFTTKPPGTGTGLGLAIAYGIIKMHRGQIYARSQIGQGTTFVVQLPLTLPPVSGANERERTDIHIGLNTA